MNTHRPSNSFNNFFRQSVNIRTVIIAGTLLLAWYLGQAPNLGYVGVVLAIALSLVVMRYPQLGIVGLIVSALVIPFAIGTGTQTQLPLVFLGIPILWGFWFIANIYFRRPISALSTRVSFVLLGFIAAASLSLLSGYLPWNAFAELAPIRAQLGGWALFVFSAAALLLTGLLIDSIKWLKVVVIIFLALAFAYLLIRIVPTAPLLNQLFVSSATGSVFWIWVVALAGGQLIFNKQLNTQIKVVLALILGCLFYVSLVNPLARTWASGWVPALAVLCLLIVLRWPRLSIVLGSLFAIVLLINYRFVLDVVLEGDNAYSLLTRGAAFEVLLKIIEADPWLGLGPANYYYYTPLYSILGYYVSFNSHNQYIDILAQVGVIGMIFYLWTFAELILLAWRLRPRVAHDGFANGYLFACIAGAAGMLLTGMLGDWVIPFVYNIGVAGFRASVLGWIFLGGLLTLNHLYSPETLQEPVVVPVVE
jgi:hypothetical protein